MINGMELINSLFPFIGLAAFLLGIYFKNKNLLILALWVSLISLLMHYRASGGEILGNYFNYLHAVFYSINLFVLLFSILYLFFFPRTKKENLLLRYGEGLVAAGLITGFILIMINVWINALFVENRYPGTPILQVATFSTENYCNYRYIFYTLSKNKKLKYMCPNHYGLLPSVGELSKTPNDLIKQLPAPLQAKFNPV